MKRLIPLFMIAIALPAVKAQDQTDALRYALTFAGGTARSTAMGGAFGALGGDFASASQNPAGIGVYRSSEFTFTPELFYSNLTSRYNGSTKTDFKYNFNLNNLGYVAAFNKGKEGFIGGAFAFGYNRLKTFHSNIRIEGVNTTSSLGQAFVESANIGDGNGPVGLDYLEPFSEGLFFDSEIMGIDTFGYYFLNPALLDTEGNPNSLQRNNIERSGKMNEWVFSLGFNYGHFFYFGGTFGIIPVEYNETSTFSEFDGNDNTREYFRFHESLSVQGTGYTGKFGIIIKPVSMLRIGLAAHLPTTYNLYEERNANMRSFLVNETQYPIDADGYLIDVGSYDYQVITPAKYIGSIGLSFAKILILSTDVEYINYASMRLRNGGDGYDFDNENQSISDTYRKNMNIKSGAELRLDNLYLRGGFGYYGSPYQKDEPNFDAYHLNYSGGFGFRNEHAFIDFSVSYLTNRERLVLYSIQNQANPVSTELEKDNIRTMMTCGFKF
jgi:hypothetical protein